MGNERYRTAYQKYYTAPEGSKEERLALKECRRLRKEFEEFYGEDLGDEILGELKADVRYRLMK